VSGRRHVVAEVGEIPDGGRKIVRLEGREIGLFHVDGEYFALRNRCPHQGGALCDGQLFPSIISRQPGEYICGERRLLACPWHGWEFDIRTGKSWFDPEKLRVRSYDVSVVDERELTPGPYRAETYTATVEKQYVVVEL
jgi:3-phenylpropionate/trans-cinnamate dioxygenase ferredoxin subunit